MVSKVMQVVYLNNAGDAVQDMYVPYSMNDNL